MLSTASLSDCLPGIPDTFADEVPMGFCHSLPSGSSWFQLIAKGFDPFYDPQFNFPGNRSPLSVSCRQAQLLKELLAFLRE